MAFENDNDFWTSTIQETKIKAPEDYKVILINDDYTTKEFVVDVLETVFHKSSAEAVSIMEMVHKTGMGTAGIYPYDIAVTRANMAISMARKEGFPLQCIVNKA